MATLEVTVLNSCNNLNSISTGLSSFDISTFKPILDIAACDYLKNVNYKTATKKTTKRYT